ncbi:MAG: recombinase family protein [Alteromonadaceae bacterium]|nr:recombinase family protein [Alteromonadaceae bacterium]
MRVYAYLRASTCDQDETRAKSELIEFATDKQIEISAWFFENESGAKLNRPELFRLLDIAVSGDVVLVENVDRISRLNTKDWEALKHTINSKGLRVVSLDLPTSHQLLQTGDEFTERMLTAINTMMLDMLAAIARKDYDDRKRRQAQGIAKAKGNGLYKGRRDDFDKQRKIYSLLEAGKSYNYIQDIIGCSRGLVAKVSNNRQRELST